jgi:hypothetical protein
MRAKPPTDLDDAIYHVCVFIVFVIMGICIGLIIGPYVPH